MIWIYTIFIQIFMCLVFATSGAVKMFFLGLEIGTLIGQVIFFINEIRK